MHSYDTLVDCCHMYLTARSAALSVVQEEIDKQAVDDVPSNAPATLSLPSASSKIRKPDKEQVTSSYNPAPDIYKNGNGKESKKEKREEEENSNINGTARPLKRGMDDMTGGSKKARSANLITAPTPAPTPTPACGGNTSLVADTVDAVIYAHDTSSKESMSQSRSMSESQPLQKYQNGSSLKPRNVAATAMHVTDSASASMSVSTSLKDRHRDSATQSPLAVRGEDESSVSLNMSETQNSNGSQETVDLGSVDVAECADMHDIPVPCSLRIKAEAVAEAEAKAEDKKLFPVAPAPPPSLFSSCLPGMSYIPPSSLFSSCLPGMSYIPPSSLFSSCLPGMRPCV